ncbi:MAG TPA: transporter [Steroidobacteraceae bacterium]|nr:transporter [Steroidobacteraceae bacterium]
MAPLAAVTALALGTVDAAVAQSMEPLSYTNSPIGLNFLIAGYAYQTGSVLVDPSLPLKNVHATVDSAILAYSRVIDCWGQSGSVAVVVPYAWLSASGDVFAQSRNVDRTGLSDLALRLSVNLYGAAALSLEQFAGYHQDVIVGVSLVVTAPSGQYIPSKLVNIGTNRWSAKPELGLSKKVGLWTFEAAAGVTFFSDNDEFFGNNVHRQDPLFAVQGHVIYNFNRKLWASLDGTYYTGGRTSLNGNLDNDLQRDSRSGATLAYSLARHNSIKLYFSSGVTARAGSDFKIYGIAWQYRWGAGL